MPELSDLSQVKTESEILLETLVNTPEFIQSEWDIQYQHKRPEFHLWLKQIRGQPTEQIRTYDELNIIMEKCGFKEYFLQDEVKEGIIDRILSNLDKTKVKHHNKFEDLNYFRLSQFFYDAVIEEVNNSHLQETISFLIKQPKIADQSIPVHERFSVFVLMPLTEYIMHLYGTDYKKIKNFW